jgi:N-methylhydantoinase A
VTTEGFGDLLEIGRLRLMRLYDMDQERPAPLVRRRWRFEVLLHAVESGSKAYVAIPLTVETSSANTKAKTSAVSAIAFDS